LQGGIQSKIKFHIWQFCPQINTALSFKIIKVKKAQEIFYKLDPVGTYIPQPLKAQSPTKAK
jgi:hypothetical protein